MLLVGGARSTSNHYAGTGTAVGTCGELVQGFTSAGRPFHVTCPIEKTATVAVTLKPADELSVHQPKGRMDKLILGITKAAEYLNMEPCEIHVSHWTDLDTSKGMGSSTADIVAGARAIGEAANRPLNASELASIATSVESSDGSMHSGIVAFDHKGGGLVRRYKWWPQFLVVMLVPPKALNTESANFAGKLALGAEFDDILSVLDKASEEHDIKAFAQSATRSARLNQKFVPNPHFALLEDRIEDLGAIGMNVGHTGTIVGLLFDASQERAQKTAAAAAVEVQSLFPDTRVEMVLTPPCEQE